MMDDACAELERLLREKQPFVGMNAPIWDRISELPDVEDCIRDGLARSRAIKDWSMFENYVLAAIKKPSRSMTPILCEVLRLRSFEVNSDDIVVALAEIRDPASVGCLAETIWWEPDWDEFRHLAVKCVWALAAINDDAAVAVLRDAASTGSEEVRKEAVYQLERLGSSS